MNIKSVLLSATVCAFLGACTMQKNTSDQSMNACNTSAAITKTLTDQKGTIVKDEKSGRYALRVVTPGTIDEVSMYLICNPDSSLTKEGNMATLSGNVRASKQMSNMGGLTYYDFEVTKGQ
ncbi:hypothetical protein [Pedobacter terrae]|uniref:hypothetical protein n=1 Tax=Pedobacter terrae TaxID=405671 RepID=UPI002FF899B7